MNPTLTIFTLSLRSIFRERVAASMLGLLALVLLLLPLGLQGDGTLEGAIRMHIRYSLGFSFVLLAGMTLWVSCASVAGDLRSKRLQMILTKPVSRSAVWIGKWSAVVTLVTLLALVCGSITLFRIHSLVQNADLTPQERENVRENLLTARRPADIPRVDLSGEAEVFFEQQLDSGALPANASREDLLPRMERYLRVQRFAADPASTSSWQVPLSMPLKQGESVQLFYAYDTLGAGSTDITGEWILSGPNGRIFKQFPIDESPRGDKVIPFLVSPEMAGTSVLVLSFQSSDANDAKIFFKVEKGIRIFRAGGSFTMNLIKAVLLLAGLLSLLAAIGVSCGSLFSLPVACYSASVVLLVQGFSGVVSDVVESGPPVASDTVAGLVLTLAQLRYVFFQFLLWIIQPLQVESPLNRVAEGIRIPTAEVFSVILFRFTPFIAVVALVGLLLFSRREVGEAS